ncbi:hypothetical protein BpHYR1_018990, partial [Brachionus plicatilis]
FKSGRDIDAIIVLISSSPVSVAKCSNLSGKISNKRTKTSKLKFLNNIAIFIPNLGRTNSIFECSIPLTIGLLVVEKVHERANTVTGAKYDKIIICRQVVHNGLNESSIKKTENFYHLLFC